MFWLAVYFFFNWKVYDISSRWVMQFLFIQNAMNFVVLLLSFILHLHIKRTDVFGKQADRSTLWFKYINVRVLCVRRVSLYQIGVAENFWKQKSVLLPISFSIALHTRKCLDRLSPMFECIATTKSTTNVVRAVSTFQSRRSPPEKNAR